MKGGYELPTRLTTQNILFAQWKGAITNQRAYQIEFSTQPREDVTSGILSNRPNKCQKSNQWFRIEQVRILRVSLRQGIFAPIEDF